MTIFKKVEKLVGLKDEWSNLESELDIELKPVIQELIDSNYLIVQHNGWNKILHSEFVVDFTIDCYWTYADSYRVVVKIELVNDYSIQPVISLKENHNIGDWIKSQKKIIDEYEEHYKRPFKIYE